MLSLDRNAVVAPACLADYAHPIQTWANHGFSNQCKPQVRAALVELQGKPGVTLPGTNETGVRCAYCEGPIYHGGHIEHFRRKRHGHFPELCFEWTNLFLACGALTHCGHYKDRGSAPTYDPALLLKPDEVDASAYFYFHASGNVDVNVNCDVAEQVRARETIRIFALDEPSLCGARAKALAAYRKIMREDLDELAAWSTDERTAYLCDEIKATQYDPYATAIKHFLTKSC